MANRHVPIITGAICASIGAGLILGVGSWWAWLIGVPFGIYGWTCLKFGFTAQDDELVAMTSFKPMSKATKDRIRDRL